MSLVFRTICVLSTTLLISVDAAQVARVKERVDRNLVRAKIVRLLESVEQMAHSGSAPAFDKVNDIKKIVQDELITDLQATHASAVSTVASNLKSIKLCSTQGTARMADIRTVTETSVASARTAHEACREEEKARHSTRGTRCGELDTFLETINDPANLPTSRPRAGMVQFVQTMSNYYCPKGPEVTSLNQACDEAEAERAKHEAECDRKQSTFEAGFCTWRTELVDNCETLDSCHSKAEQAYKDHVTTTTELVTKWKLEWAALQKILCYTDVWLSDSDVTTADAGAYGECNSKVPDTTSMDIDFGTPDPEVACPLTSVANYPGSSGFVTAEYSDIGEFAKSPIACISSGKSFDGLAGHDVPMDVPMDSYSAPTLPPMTEAPTPAPTTLPPTTTTPSTTLPPTTTTQGGSATYYLGKRDEACPTPIETSEECKEAAAELGGDWDGDRNWSDRCFGCMWTTGDKDTNFNSNRAGKCGNADQVTVCIQAPGQPSPEPVKGDLLATHGGWEFYKVATDDTTDDGVKAACLGAGMVVPCTGADGCHYNDDVCTQTSEAGCGNPMLTTAKEIGCDNPRGCDSLNSGGGTFAYMGQKWISRIACGSEKNNWCSRGSKTNPGHAFCARKTGSLAEVGAQAQVRRHDTSNQRTKEIVEADGSIHSFFEMNVRGSKCSSLYTADMCPSGKLADNQDDIECGEDPCVDDAADDGLCCLPIEDDNSTSLAASVSKTYKPSDLEHMEVSDLMDIVKSMGGATDAKAALAKKILNLQSTK